MDPLSLLIVAVVVTATVVWLILRRRAEGALTPEERLEQAALRADRDRQRTDAIEAADRANLTGPPPP